MNETKGRANLQLLIAKYHKRVMEIEREIDQVKFIAIGFIEATMTSRPNLVPPNLSGLPWLVKERDLLLELIVDIDEALRGLETGW